MTIPVNHASKDDQSGAMAREVQRVKEEAIQQALWRRNETNGKMMDQEPLSRLEKGYAQDESSIPVAVESLSTPPLVLLEGVDPSDPRLPKSIQSLLDPSTDPTTRNRLVRTRPLHDMAFGHSRDDITYYPDHIPFPACCHWLVTALCLALAVPILMGEIATYEDPKDVVGGAIIVLLLCVIPALWCFRWGRRNQQKRQALFADGQDAVPGRWRHGYYTIGTTALVDYHPKTGVWVFPVEHIDSIYQRSSGSGGERTTSYHLHYRTTLLGEEEGQGDAHAKKKGRRQKNTKKILLSSQGTHLVFWWKHKVKGVPTWSEKQAQERRLATSMDASKSVP